MIELEKGVHGAVNGRAIREATRPECVDPPGRGNEKRQPDAEGIALHGLSLSDFRSGPLNGFRRENRTKVWSKMCAAIRGVCLMAEGTPPAHRPPAPDSGASSAAAREPTDYRLNSLKAYAVDAS